MTKAKNVPGIAAALGILILILDSKTAFAGASQGINLCIRTVIPSLFPFFVLSAVMIPAFQGRKSPFPLRLVPEGAESLLLIGFLGGYPVGARCVADAYRSGQLSRSQAERMLGFCSNAGPSFLFGLIGPMFPDMRYPWMLWGIHVVSAVLAGFILPKPENQSAETKPGQAISFTEALNASLLTMAVVCGWIVLFRVGISFLDRWILWLLPVPWQVLLTGFAELSNGCCALGAIDDVPLRFLVCSAMLALGGLCVTMQTVSVTQGLRLKYYFPGKIIQFAASLLLSWALFPHKGISFLIPAASMGILLILGISMRKTQNNSSIPLPVGV